MVIRAFVGLGSNVGDRLENLRRAMDELVKEVEVIGKSSVYDTDPVGPPQPDFLNAVVEIRTELAPRDLLSRLKSIEARIGRIQGERWGPREIDLDLLLYGDEEIDEPDLRVPHPQMWERAFVLVPLAELAPDLVPKDFDRSGVRPFGRL
ncbi:MAG TPA: 2-amino-4-hydroxy-6-hydroxymethyldihydropteridine diphosphokinase [Actinomycetota bacterium]|jgi:2-amino-4-hydroxy-6-hydroxymethyldihydropteridine diphosphokinase|nr:2-amino-4-hydroxy-6-hydroxymethyldihydropteridine diphosphokinase [Actinomycetota bacterium]